jgi:hypothetical protein
VKRWNGRQSIIAPHVEPDRADRMRATAKRPKRLRFRLPRLHLLELEDQPWLPSVLRDGATDFLETSQRLIGASSLAAPRVRRLLESSGLRQIVDLASGGGGPALRMRRSLALEGLDVELLLTDRYPNRSAFAHAVAGDGARVRAHFEPVDARSVPADLPGVRTLFNALHHFEPPEVRAILADAVNDRRPIAAFELSDRSIVGLLSMAMVPLWVLLLTPLARPFRWSRLLFTYLLPAIPAVCLWDGVVSQLRTYLPEELLALAAEADSASAYRWESGRLRRIPPHGSYLIGLPGTDASSRIGPRVTEKPAGWRLIR